MREFRKPWRSRAVHATPLAAAAILLLAFLTAVSVDARGKKADVTSTFRAGDTITIDGVNEEWQGRLVPVKDTPASIGFYNDADNLYFCLVTSDSGLRSQVLRRGLILWLDQDGGKKKSFGLEYPVGMGGMTMIERRGDTGEPGVSQRPLDADRERIVILGPGKEDRQNLSLEEAKGIQAKIGENSGVLVYELKVPLRKTENEPYAIGARPDAIVGVGLETPEFQRPTTRPTMGEGGGRGPSGGGWGGMGGRGGWGGGHGGYGGRGGYGGDRRPEMPKLIKQWTTVQLAAPAGKN